MYVLQVYDNNTGDRLLTLVRSKDPYLAEKLAIDYHASGEHYDRYIVTDSVPILLTEEQDLMERIIPYKINS